MIGTVIATGQNASVNNGAPSNGVSDATTPAGFGRPDLTAFASYPNRL